MFEHVYVEVPMAIRKGGASHDSNLVLSHLFWINLECLMMFQEIFMKFHTDKIFMPRANTPGSRHGSAPAHAAIILYREEEECSRYGPKLRNAKEVVSRYGPSECTLSVLARSSISKKNLGFQLTDLE